MFLKAAMLENAAADQGLENGAAVALEIVVAAAANILTSDGD